MGQGFTDTLTKLLSDLGTWLEERELAIQMHPCREGWSVWLYAPEDCTVRICREREDLGAAVTECMTEWDRTKVDN